MTAEQLSAAAGVILSLVFSYVPPVGVVRGAGRAPTCDEVGLGQALQALLAALIANQVVFLISPQPNKGQARQGRAG
jgi:hypothetical protein